MGELQTLHSESLPAYQVDAGLMDLSVDRLDKLGAELSARYHTMVKAREHSQWEEDVAEGFNAYHLIPPNKPTPYEGAANLRSVLTRIGVDSLHANEMYSIFGNGFSAKVVPDYVSKDYVLEADKSAKFLTYVLEHEANFYMAVDDAGRKDKTYGIGYLEPRYLRQYAYTTERYQDEKEVPEIDTVTGETTIRIERRWKTRKVKRTLFDGVKIDSLPVLSVHASPFVRDLEQAVEHDVVFKDYKVRLRDVRLMSKEHDEMTGPYYLPGQVEKLSMWAVAKLAPQDDSLLEQAKQNFDGFSLHDKCMAEVLDCVEAHLWEDIDGDGLPEKITAFIHPGSGTVLRVALTPCRIVDIRSRPIDERFHGESVEKAGRPILQEWEAVHNWRVNAGQWENMPIFTYEPGGRFNPEETTLIPGHGYPVGTGINFVPTPSVRSSFYQEENLLLMYFERILGVSENMQGVASSKDVSATENIQVTQKSGIRFANPMNRVLISLNTLLGHVWDLCTLCAPATKEYFITGLGKSGRIFDKMTPKDYKAQLKFKLEISTPFDTQMMRDTWLMAYRMFRGDPQFAAHPATLYDLTKSTLKGMGLDLEIPRPSQAEVLSPSVEHELLFKGQEVEPEVGEDYDEHLRQHLAWLRTEEHDEWPEDAKQSLLLHIDKTQILKQTLESANLNKSGVYEAGMGVELPGMTASRNPSQMFNNMRVSESGPSAVQNNRNGAQT